MIEMNRVSKLLHRARFLLRQRRTLRFFRRYVISAEDIKNAKVAKEKKVKNEQERQVAQTVQMSSLLSGFDPENDAFDRRIFFEVTGKSIIPDEFIQDNSSGGGSAEWEDEQLDPFDWLMTKQEGDDDDDESQEEQDSSILLTQRTIN